MYEVHSMQRQGRPGWAWLASAMLLLLTAGLAAGLVSRRERSHHVELGEAGVYGAGALRSRLPAGWEPVPASSWPTGIVTGVAEPGRNGRKVFLFLFRDVPGVAAFARDEAARVVTTVAGALRMGHEVELHDMGAGSVGGLPGWTVGRLSISSGDQAPYLYCLGRSAASADGEIVGLLLVLPGRSQPRSWDQKLLDRISGEIELPEHEPGAEPAEIHPTAGDS